MDNVRFSTFVTKHIPHMKLLRYTLLLCLCSVLIPSVSAQESGRFDLTGTWQFREQGSTKVYNGEVPGFVQTDLMKNKVIPDPYYRDNESKVQWVSDTGWVYEKYFKLDASFFSHRNMEMVFEGIDTYANVYLNDSLILVADNMFKQWVVPVKYKLHVGFNKLRVEFPSVNKQVKSKYEALPYKVPGDERSICRKAAYQFGWDFGPKMITMGIWKPVYIRYWERTNVLGVNIVPGTKTDTSARFSAVFTLIATLADTAEFKLTVDGQPLIDSREGLKKGVNVIRADFEIVKPKLWWPNGMGKQTMYTLGYEVWFAGKKENTGEKKFGIRKIELITEKDSIGRSFYFKVNDKPVYAKGANFVPMDMFPTRVPDSAYERLIDDVAKANMNMLRIWGGGIYERDKFYELCDEKGILVWQDFMFANDAIPPSKELYTNIRDEVIQNIVRLRDHPCIALWCGNNEIEEGWRHWGWPKQYGLSKEDSTELYKSTWAVFNDIIANSVKRYDTLRPFVLSSPKFGWGNPKSMFEGDSHYWGIWWGKEPFSVYEQKVPRFMSEFGFQAYPDDATLKKFTIPSDIQPGSPVLKAHQKHAEGYEIIDQYMKRDFREPKDFGMYRYLSQVLQAEGITGAIEAQRRSKPVCRGTLFWQLNDCWPGVTWSARDYYGDKKALWYRAKQVYSDQLISAEVKNDTMTVIATTDDGRTQDINFRMFLFDFNGNVIWRADSAFKLQAGYAMKLTSASIPYLLQGNDPKKVFLYMDLKNIIGVRSAKFFYFVPKNELDLQKPVITTKVTEYEEGYKVELSTNTQALYVRLSTDVPGEFSDNYFDLVPRLNRTVLFKTKTKDPDLANKIKIISLADVWQ